MYYISAWDWLFIGLLVFIFLVQVFEFRGQHKK